MLQPDGKVKMRSCRSDILIGQSSIPLGGGYSLLQTEKQALTQLARKLAINILKDYDGRWCFFAGFAFILNGVEKTTSDIDVLTKDQVTYQYILNLLQQLGLKLVSSTSDFASFEANAMSQSAVRGLTLDLLCITSPWLKQLEGIWTQLETKKVQGTPLPIPGPVFLILLKILVNSHRQSGDRKKKQDLIDVEHLMSLRGVTSEQILKEGTAQGLQDVLRRFLGLMEDPSNS
jgi:hypothetical protein